MISCILALGVSHILQLLLESQLLSFLIDCSSKPSRWHIGMPREEVFIAAAHSTAALCTTKGLQGTRLSYQHVAQIPNSTQDLFLAQPRKQRKPCAQHRCMGSSRTGTRVSFWRHQWRTTVPALKSPQEASLRALRLIVMSKR